MFNKKNNHLELMRDKSKTFPEVDNKILITSAMVWHCSYRSLEPLATFPNLEELIIATFPDDSFEFLGKLSKLRYLQILDMPKITSLAGLEKLKNLEALSLSTSPSWDAARKCTLVDSLDPLKCISNLKYLELFGVLPNNRSLDALQELPALASARFSQYSEEEVREFYRKRPISDDFVPKPLFQEKI